MADAPRDAFVHRHLRPGLLSRGGTAADTLQGAVAAIQALGGPADLPAELVGRTLMAWSALFYGVAARLWHDLGGR